MKLIKINQVSKVFKKYSTFKLCIRNAIIILISFCLIQFLGIGYMVVIVLSTWLLTNIPSLISVNKYGSAFSSWLMKYQPDVYKAYMTQWLISKGVPFASPALYFKEDVIKTLDEEPKYLLSRYADAWYSLLLTQALLALLILGPLFLALT